MTGTRPQLARVVLCCVLGACVSLFAATRTWVVRVQVRPDPLPAVHVSHPGTALVPWLSALALVALAGAGALLATRGWVRSLVGVAIVCAGAGIVAGGGYGLTLATGGHTGWPLACV